MSTGSTAFPPTVAAAAVVPGVVVSLPKTVLVATVAATASVPAAALSLSATPRPAVVAAVAGGPRPLVRALRPGRLTPGGPAERPRLTAAIADSPHLTAAITDP